MPSCVGTGASPVAGRLLPAIEFAFDSKVCSFGFSADSFARSVSMNGGFVGTSCCGGAADKSTMVNSLGLSSGGSGGVKTPPKAASEYPIARCRKSEMRIAHPIFLRSFFSSIVRRASGENTTAIENLRPRFHHSLTAKSYRNSCGLTTSCHSERSAAKSRNPVAELQGHITGSLDFARDDRATMLGHASLRARADFRA